MCDTLCALGRDGTVFGKNSDRPSEELQLPESRRPRPPGGRLRTQYLEIDDRGADAVLLSRPDWLWGAEHGLNAHGVAIGNEKVDTRSGVAEAPPALIGMDLVRLGLERGSSASGALDVITSLIERHGQGGIGDRTFAQAYDSSFLVADHASAWVLETAGRTWAAEPVAPGGAAAISNRLTIRRDWTRASTDVPPGADFDEWRDPTVDRAYADGRLAASRAFLGIGHPAAGPTPTGAEVSARRMAAHLRDHGTGPWGEPGSSERTTSAPPAPPRRTGPGGAGVTVCMHVGGVMATTASMIAALPRPGTGPLRSWLAVGSPCVSVYVPVLGLPELGSAFADAGLWRAGAALRRRAEADGAQLAAIRRVLDPVEDALWEEADDLLDRPDRWARFHDDAWCRTRAAMAALVGSSGTRAV